MINNVHIIGLGALGVMYADRIESKAPGALKVIADSGRIEKYKTEGVSCNGRPCTFEYILPRQVKVPADLIIVAVKSTALDGAIEAIRASVGEHTTIISLLNGITSETILADAFGSEKVLLCVAQGMDAVREGTGVNYEHIGELLIGAAINGQQQRVGGLARFLLTVQIPFEVCDDMVKRQWRKLMLNVGVNQTAAVFGGTYGELQRQGEPRDFMIAAMKEVLSISQAEGINLTDDDLDYVLSVLDRVSPAGKPSMRQDIEARRKTEVELFSGTVRKLGIRHGIDTPVNDELYKRITGAENSYK